MKKILVLSLSLVLLSVAASAQQDNVGNRTRRHRVERGFNNEQITGPERHQLRRDHFRYKIAQHRARRDGFVGPIERRRLHKMRNHNRHEMFRYKHNRRHRVI
ncbi:MAG TPA: hypothetical protein VKC90_10740 [Chitinophagaceae bacterium]|nr:hypothetical protein [Chitinophagaceae bacterium]